MPTVTHNVLLKVLPDASPAAVAAALESLRALVGVCPGLLSYSGGAYASPEGLNRGYTHGFTMIFDSPAARNAYLVHEAHVAAAGLVLAVTGGIDNVLAFDFEA